MKLITVALITIFVCVSAHARSPSRAFRNTKTRALGGAFPRSPLVKGVVQGKADGVDGALIKCHFVERDFGEGASGVLIRRCKIKRPFKKRLDLTCEFGDFLCKTCEASRCDAFKNNRRMLLHHLAKLAIENISNDKGSKHFYCGSRPLVFREPSCSVEMPLSSNWVAGMRTKGSTPTTTSLASTTVAPSTTTRGLHKDCKDDPNETLCDAFMRWSDFLFKGK